jgi:hypothetical protein
MFCTDVSTPVAALGRIWTTGAFADPGLVQPTRPELLLDVRVSRQ